MVLGSIYVVRVFMKQPLYARRNLIWQSMTVSA